MNYLKSLTLPALACLMFASSCKKEDPIAPNSQSASEAKAGTYNVRMKDAPGDYNSLDVEIDKVEVYNSTDGWITLNNQSQIIAVLDLTNGNNVQIASKSDMKYGTYTKVRVTFGDDYDLKVNSNATVSGGSGSIGIGLGVSVNAQWSSNNTITLNVQNEINASSGADVLLDFNVAESVQDNGNDNYMIDPVLTIVTHENTGARGSLKDRTQASVKLESTTTTETYSTYTNDNGEFYINGMVSGDYDLIISAADDNDNSTEENFTLQSVTIVDGEIKQMGEIDF
jgi:hypothetical protein